MCTQCEAEAEAATETKAYRYAVAMGLLTPEILLAVFFFLVDSS